HAAAIGMATEDHPVELLPADKVDDVVHVPLKIDAPRQGVALLRHAAERRREHLMPPIAKRAPDSRPAPAAVPGTVHQNEGCHPCLPLLSLFDQSTGHQTDFDGKARSDPRRSRTKSIRST